MYLFAKSIHIMFVVFLMAGMLYLPRLFVYHATTRKDSDAYPMLLMMEGKLLKVIMLPAMIVVIISGVYLFVLLGGFSAGKWIHIKILLASMMFAMHGFFAHCYKKFLNYNNQKSHKFFRIINEIPALILVGIVLVVIFR